LINSGLILAGLLVVAVGVYGTFPAVRASVNTAAKTAAVAA
jgi:hypothetical protein